MWNSALRTRYMGTYASSFQKNKSIIPMKALASLELLTNACLPCALGSNNGSGRRNATV